MSYKDSLRKSQGGNTSFLKLPVVKTYKVKEDDQGKVGFAHYVKSETGGTNEFTDSLEGILIGTAMKMEVFDNRYGQNGGTYNTTHYFSKQDEVAVFSPTGDLEKKLIALEAEDLLNLRGTVKKRSCLFLLTEEGLIEVQSNVSLTIEQVNNIKKGNPEAFLNQLISLSPAVYEAKKWSKDVQKILKIAANNPPKYAEITLGAEITEEMAEQVNLVDISEQFVKWKNQIQGKEDVLDLPAPSTIQNKYTDVVVSAGEPTNEMPFPTADDEVF